MSDVGTLSTTPRQIINMAARKVGIVGIGETLAAEDINDAFFELQAMLAQWQQRRWLVYHLIEVIGTSTGAQSYTVGPGADFDCLRPDSLEFAFFRQYADLPQPVDFPFEIISAREDYSRLVLKTLGSYPRYLFYDSAYPTGTIYLTPVPAPTQFEIHLVIKENLGALTSLVQSIVLPPEYQQPLIYNLAVLLATSYGLTPIPDVKAIAAAGLETIRNANAQIPMLRSPWMSGSQGWYNPFSDQVN